MPGAPEARSGKDDELTKKYNIVYADPPWRYHTPPKHGNSTRGPELHYSTMHTADICALPVKNIAADDSVLFLWATFPKLPDALEVIKAWGFTFTTVGFVWIKKNRKSDSLFWGMGSWTRSNAEFCLIARRGTPRRISCGVHQVMVGPVEKHSKKPDETRERILQLMGDLPCVELFARQAPPGWDVWGNEVESTIPDFGPISYPNKATLCRGPRRPEVTICPKGEFLGHALCERTQRFKQNQNQDGV